MVNIGIVGMGFMGTTHFYAAQKLEGARVAAIVTRDPKKKQGDWSGVGGNLGTGGGKADLTGVSVYDTLDELLSDPGIDLVDVCLPTHMHKGAAIKALQAGKHVLVEKPIALAVADADAMIEAGRQSGKRLLVAHVLRFFPEFLLVRTFVESGEYGKLTALHLKRVISQPDWRQSNRADENGGIVLDLHVHDVNFVQFVRGLPRRVFASGVVNEQGEISYLASQFLFDDETAISAHCGGLAQASIPFEHAYDAYFERATISYSSAGGGVRLYTKDGKVENPPVSSADAFAAELQYAVDTITGKVDGALLSAESARDSLRLCHLLSESVRKGAPVAV